MDARNDTLRVILADGVRGHAEGDHARELHLLEHVVAQGLLVHGHVVATPHRGDEQVRLGRDGLGDVGGEVRGAELRPALGDDLGAGDHLLHHDVEMREGVAPVGVVRMDVGDPANLGPGHGGRHGRRHAVGRLHVGDAEDVVRVEHRLVEEEVGAPIDEDGEQLERLRLGPEGRRVAARDDPGEEIDLLRELHPAHFLHVGVGARGLVGLDGLDLALTQQSALGVDLLGGQDMALVRGLSEHGGRAREEGHVPDLVRRVGNIALGLRVGSLDESRCADERHAGRGRRGADGDAEPAQEIATAYFCGHMESLLRWVDCFSASEARRRWGKAPMGHEAMEQDLWNEPMIAGVDANLKA